MMSKNVMAGSASEAWNNVKAGLMNGVYFMRYGKIDGRNTQIIQVRK